MTQARYRCFPRFGIEEIESERPCDLPHQSDAEPDSIQLTPKSSRSNPTPLGTTADATQWPTAVWETLLPHPDQPVSSFRSRDLSWCSVQKTSLLSSQYFHNSLNPSPKKKFFFSYRAEFVLTSMCCVPALCQTLLGAMGPAAGNEPKGHL